MNRPPSPLEAHIGYWLRILSNAVSGSFAARLEKHGVSVPQWVVMRLLFNGGRGGHCSVTAIAAALDIDKGAVSRMIDRLIKLGLATREDSAESRREVVLALTARAKTLVHRLAREADETDRAFFSVLTARQRGEFLKTIKLLIAAHDRGGKGAKIPTH